MEIPGGRAPLLADVAVVAWVVAWIVVAVAVTNQVRDLRELADTVVVAGQAIEETGSAIGFLRELPLVGGIIGDQLEAVERRVGEAGESAIVSGRVSRRAVEDTAVLLGVTIALAPTLPLLVVYAFLRTRRVREALAVRRALQAAPASPALREYLARRAVEGLGYARLRRVSADPWRDLEEGRHDALAAAQLERLGLRRPGW